MIGIFYLDSSVNCVIIRANKIITFIAINVTSNGAVILLQLSRSPKSVHEERKTEHFTLDHSELRPLKKLLFKDLYNRISSQYITSGKTETKYPT